MRVLVLTFALIGALACGPIIVIPGGALGGDVEPVPSDWSFTDEIKTVQLETSPEDPYSVNVWGVGVGRDFYIAAGSSTNAWAENIAQDDRVRLRIAGKIYEMRALRDDTPEARESFLAAAKTKYDFEPDEEQAWDAILFRLEPR
jgi:hypothetical protein